MQGAYRSALRFLPWAAQLSALALFPALMWIVSLGFGSASTWSFLISCHTSLRAFKLLFYLLPHLERLCILNRKYQVLLGRFHRGSYFPNSLPAALLVGFTAF